jgi:hypothetical protein
VRPFEGFRSWARGATVTERVATTVASVIVVALLAWLLVPDVDDPSGEDVAALRNTATEGIATGTDGGPGTAGATPDANVDFAQADTAAGTDTARGESGIARSDSADAGGRGEGPGATAASGAPGARSTPTGSSERGCVSPPGATKGITGKEVKIVVALTEIAGPAANSVFGLPPPTEQRADFEAAINGINREGGVACRKLVAEYVNANPADESQMMQLCRDVATRDVFAVMDTGSLASRPAVLACLGQRKVPFFGAFFITETARQQFYPYLFSFYTKEHLYKSTAFGLRHMGFYDVAKGFQKLGFIYRDCEQQAIDAFRSWIREAGVPDGSVVTYNVGCPAAFANEADLAQAVLTFKNEGVTHVTIGNFMGDIARFTSHAEVQGFRPRYGFPDEALVSVTSGPRAPNPDNIANAIAIALGREGENHTPGMVPTAGSQRCDVYRRAAGLPPVYESHAIAGNACNQLWMLQGAVGRAPQLTSTALQVGLQRTKSIDFSYPQGPNDFTGNRVTTGGQFWRVAQFMPDCDCWRVIQREFRRG